MSGTRQPLGPILVWFEDSAAGRAALTEARALAGAGGVRLEVLTVAPQEPLSGCGRCRQGAAIWNREMRRMAQEDLQTARALLGDGVDAAYQAVVGDPVDAITGVAARAGARTILLPPQPRRPFGPSSRRNVSRRVAQALGLAAERGGASDRLSAAR